MSYFCPLPHSTLMASTKGFGAFTKKDQEHDSKSDFAQ